MRINITFNRLFISLLLSAMSLCAYSSSLPNKKEIQLKIEVRQKKYILHIPDTLLHRDILYGARTVSLSRQYNT